MTCWATVLPSSPCRPRVPAPSWPLTRRRRRGPGRRSARPPRHSVDEVHALVDMLRSDAADAAAVDIDTGADADDRSSGDSGAGAGPTGDTVETVDPGTGTAAGGGVVASDHEDGLELLRQPVRQAQRVGLPVTLETDPFGRIPPATVRVLHRVAQESLTNVLRHAPGAATSVSLRTGAGRGVLVVENAPAPEPPTGDAGPYAEDRQPFVSRGRGGTGGRNASRHIARVGHGAPPRGERIRRSEASGLRPHRHA